MRYSSALGKKSSRAVLGTTYFGDGISREEAFILMDTFYALGGTHLDTARSYADGRAEIIVGEWLKSRGHKDVFVGTKGGFPSAAEPLRMRLSEEEIRGDLEESLRALGVDCLDFYWLHRDDEALPTEPLIRLLNDFVKEGKILRFGASNWSAARMREASELARKNGLQGFSAGQIRFSPARIREEAFGLVGINPREYAYYRSKELPLVAFSSQAKGFFSKMASGGEDALSPKAKERYLSEENRKKAKLLKEMAEARSCSVAGLIGAAFQSLSHPEVFAIVGSRTPLQLEDSLSGSDLILTPEECEAVFRGIIL